MRSVVFLSSVLLLFGCKSKSINSNFIGKDELHVFLNNWHQSAAEAHFDDYFNAIADDGIFIGTDATENWNKEQFKVFAKPYFDRGKAWNFKAIQRNIYFSKDQKTVWFDELLTTQMKICRGSGVIQKTKDGWKIKHYVLSMTVPNENVDEVVKVKAKLEDILLDELVKK
ncbi:nuclear transport factor 2 family protein [Flavobacterium sp.]|uniref:nuclear transport factor 2 family protein n=1 Tax=Flavobacterium sp. TaxID=239 RepID=UPI0025C1BDED|nr:nuclear transport factor 2 family protein [Flavobacterium sp.]